MSAISKVLSFDAGISVRQARSILVEARHNPGFTIKVGRCVVSWDGRFRIKELR